MTRQVRREFLDPRVLSRLAALSLEARRPMLGTVSGRHRSPIRGSSLEFSEYRKYVPGDDPRRLDWRAYARSDRFFIKEFEADTNLRMCLVIDTSGSMQFGEDGGSKLDYAKRVAGTLACLAARQGDAVGLRSAGSRRCRQIPPQRNAAHLRHVLDEIAALSAEGPTGLPDALHETAARVRQRALIVVLSDLFVEPASLRGSFQHLKFRKHDVAVFHLLERREMSFPFQRTVRFLDLEGGAPMLADPSVIRRQYQQDLRTYLDTIHDIMRDSTTDYHRVQIHEPHGDVLARFLLARMRKR